MSLMTGTPPEQEKPTYFPTLRPAATKAIKAAFEEPFRTVYLLTLVALVVSLLFGRNLPYMFFFVFAGWTYGTFEKTINRKILYLYAKLRKRNPRHAPRGHSGT